MIIKIKALFFNSVSEWQVPALNYIYVKICIAMNIRMSIMAVSVTTVSGPSVVAGHHSSFKPFLFAPL